MNIHPQAAECPRRQDALDGRAEQARHPFTPEPWESVEGGRYVRAKGRCVAKLDWDIRDATDEANARLIAAAPEQHEALEPFATAARRISPQLPDTTEITLSIGEREIYRVSLGSLRAAHAAHAKARGEQ